MEDSTVNQLLKKNEEFLKNKIGQGNDINYRHLIIPAFNNCEALVVSINKMVNKKEINESIIAPLIEYNSIPKKSILQKNKTSLLIKSGIFANGVKESNCWNEICDSIVKGYTVLFIDKCDYALIISTIGYEKRSIQEPITESEIRGPRDGFIEDINTNMSLIRRRIRDHSLRFENLIIGEKTKTDVTLAYIENLVNESILEEVRTRLSKINVDSVLASGYIEEFIEDSPYSIFPQIEHTERPDKASAAILEGRIVILVDNTPFVLIVPIVFWSFIQTSGDYYERYFIGTFLRWIRLLALFLGISLSSFYVLLSSFHQEMLPTVLALKISEGRQGVPFPALIEALIMEILLEITKEAGLRMPRPIGQTVSIVGTFIIGQAAVSAGIVGPVLVISIAVSAICSYAIPSYSLSNALRIIRFPLLLASATFGILGYLGGIIIIFLHLLSLRTFGEPFLAPLFPYEKSGIKDVLIRSPWWTMLKRPRHSHAKDSNRQTTQDLMPKPPNQE